MNVVSFSLFGSDPKYTIGAMKNADLCKVFFKGWQMRVYHDSSVPKDILFGLELSGVELIRKDDTWGEGRRMWRFFPVSDCSIGYFISRDCDSRLSERDAEAVAEWMESGKAFHVIRDHPGHTWPMMAGAWGAKGGSIPMLADMIESTMTTDFLADVRDADQAFLKAVVYPEAKRSLFAHSDNLHFELQAVPIKRARELDDFAFIGEPVGADDVPIRDFRKVLRQRARSI